MTAQLVDTETGEIVHGVVPFDASVIEQAADPGRFVELACARAKEWLAEALTRGDIEGIVELKSQAEAIRTYTAQKQLGKDAELSAQEIVRRAERGIGLAIRRGQEAGEIAKRGDIGGGSETRSRSSQHLVKPTDLVPSHELSGGGAGPGIYKLTDDVTDEQFEQAIEDAKAEENLSRANVVRKAKGEPRKRKWTDETFAAAVREMAEKGNNSAQIAAELGMTEEYVRRRSRTLGVVITADEVTRGMQGKRPDSNVVVEGIVAASEVPATVLELITFAALNPQHLERWISSLSDSIRSLTTLKNNLKKELTRDAG